MEISLLISKNILLLRKKNKLTQSELADKLNYTEQAISKWERGLSLPDPVTLYNLAEIFNVSVSYFYEEHNDIEINQEIDDQLSHKEKRIKIIFIISITIINLLLLLTIVSLTLVEIGINKFNASFIVIPCVSLCILIINTLYGKKKYFTLLSSITLWTTSNAFYIFNNFKKVYIYIFLITIILQITLIAFPLITKHFNELRGNNNPSDKTNDDKNIIK